MRGVVLLHSGGMDSHIAWLLHPWMHPVYVLHGASNEANELAALARLRELDPRFKCEGVLGPQLVGDDTGHIPYRNMMLLTTVAHAMPSWGIAFGALRGEGTGDKSRAFVRALHRTWRTSEPATAPRILTPLRRYTKAGALRQVQGLRGVEALHATVSCYEPGGPCGVCQACFRRGVAEYLVGWQDAMPLPPSNTHGIMHALRSVPPSHVPAMVLANLDVLRGYARQRRAR